MTLTRPAPTMSRRAATLTLAVASVLASALTVAGAAHAGSDGTTVEIEDNHGTHVIAVPPQSVVALDNRTFQLLSDWGVPLSAAAVALMPADLPYTHDDSILDIGLHRDPNFELIVAAEPDLVINGQRFWDRQEELVELVPDAAVINLEPRDGEPFGEELKRQVTVLGEVFGKQDEAAALTDEFDAAVARVIAAYDPADTVMAVNTSGGNIGYLAPGVGRSLGPLFDILGLTPALEVDGATNDHQGDEISVEAIAASNPTWILVLDRDAVFAADDPTIQPGADIIEGSEALANVTAIQQGNIVYMPADTYLNEGLQTYTEFLNAFADALEGAA